MKNNKSTINDSYNNNRSNSFTININKGLAKKLSLFTVALTLVFGGYHFYFNNQIQIENFLGLEAPISYQEVPSEVLKEGFLQVISDIGRVHENENVNSDIISKIKKGEFVKFEGEKTSIKTGSLVNGTWIEDYMYKVEYSADNMGWIFGGCLNGKKEANEINKIRTSQTKQSASEKSLSKILNGTITVDKVNFREGHSLNAEIIKELPLGQKIKVVAVSLDTEQVPWKNGKDADGYWYKVKIKTKDNLWTYGWVHEVTFTFDQQDRVNSRPSTQPEAFKIIEQFDSSLDDVFGEKEGSNEDIQTLSFSKPLKDKTILDCSMDKNLREFKNTPNFDCQGGLGTATFTVCITPKGDVSLVKHENSTGSIGSIKCTKSIKKALEESTFIEKANSKDSCGKIKFEIFKK